MNELTMDDYKRIDLSHQKRIAESYLRKNFDSIDSLYALIQNSNLPKETIDELRKILQINMDLLDVTWGNYNANMHALLRLLIKLAPTDNNAAVENEKNYFEHKNFEDKHSNYLAKYRFFVRFGHVKGFNPDTVDTPENL